MTKSFQKMYPELLKEAKFINLIRRAARDENIDAQDLSGLIERGHCVITQNIHRKLTKPCAIGKNLKTKINVNLGTSPEKPNLSRELKKLEIALKLKSDAVMDLSLGGDLRKNRRAILSHSCVPVGTVPIYEAAMRAQKRRGSFLKLEKQELFDVLQEQAHDGVDFFTVHCGINRKSVEVFRKNPRILDIVSRGGALLVNWMEKNNAENPLFEYFDEILKIAKTHRITLSLGDGMRPGSILDATDPVQIEELKELGKLTQRARRFGVQVLIEGPGHVPLDQIKKNMELEKEICDGAPFYVLGPLVTDTAVGYDHITGAIGGAFAAYWGADFLCFLTPAEHVRHPSINDTREGIIASKIAAHAADIAKGVPGAIDWDRRMSIARKARDWNSQVALSMDPEKARKYHQTSHPKLKDVCTMCGEFCSIRLIDKASGQKKRQSCKKNT